jgi:hypothetical protein
VFLGIKGGVDSVSIKGGQESEIEVEKEVQEKSQEIG